MLYAFADRHGRLRLKGSPVIASRSRHCLVPLARYLAVASVKPDNHLPHCQNFWSPLAAAFLGGLCAHPAWLFSVI